MWIDKTKSYGFQGVPENVWNFHLGGYQVCEKWLKDRKGRTLSADDINHYHRIIVALNETISIMAEIDQVIEAHGGWPGAFQDRQKDTVATYASEFANKAYEAPFLMAAEKPSLFDPAKPAIKTPTHAVKLNNADWKTWEAISKWAKQTTGINTYWENMPWKSVIFSRAVSDHQTSRKKI